MTSPRGSTVTCITAGNALGNSVPPFYVFPGVQWNDSFLEGAATGAAGTMSKSGWSNSEVFQSYLNKHCLKYSNVSTGSPTEPTLVLYDGHRSLVSLTLTNWARRNNIILFVLPPHTSHLTQPLDVGIFGPFKSMYNKKCQDYMKHNPGLSITSVVRLLDFHNRSSKIIVQEVLIDDRNYQMKEKHRFHPIEFLPLYCLRLLSL